MFINLFFFISWLGLGAQTPAGRVIPHISTQPISDAIY